MALQIALVGYGFAGKTLHAPLIGCVAGLTLATVVSSDEAKVRRDLPEVRVTASADEAFADPSIDAVVIATPNDSHCALGLRALAAGKHVVIDKPVTTTVAEAEELVQAAARTGRLLSVFHCRRWDADFLTLRGLIESGALGEVMYLESRYDRYRPEVMPRWRERPGPGTGIWFDLGSHLVDQAVQLFGVPESVSADLEMQRAGSEAVDYFHVSLRYGKRRVVLHGSNLVVDSARRFEVHGTRASYSKTGMDPQEPLLRRGGSPGGPGWGIDPVSGTLTEWAGGGEPRRRSLPNVPADYRAYYRGVLRAIREGAPNPVTPLEALVVMRVLEAACRSAAERRLIPVG